MPCLSIIIPACNEEECIGSTLAELFEVLEGSPRESEVILIDDGSIDNTSAVADTFRERHENLKIVRLEKNLGMGGAVTAGIKHSTGSIGLLIPADGQFRPDEIDAFADALEDSSMVIGIRKDREVYDESRKIQSHIYLWSVSLLFGQDYPDVNWVQGWRMKDLEGIEPESRGVFFLQEMICRFRMTGGKIRFVESTMRKRKGGEAKGKKPSVIISTIWEMLGFWLFRYLPWKISGRK